MDAADTIRLTSEDLREPLPPICIVTGEDTEETLLQKFSWTPGWVYILLIINWLICLIVALIVTKKMTLVLPMIEDQRHYFKKRAWIQAWLVVSSIISLGGCGIAAVAFIDDNNVLAISLGLFGVVSFLVLLIVAAIYTKNGVHVTEITENSIRFEKAHPRFIEAVLQDREERKEERRRWHSERRAMRDKQEPPQSRSDAEERDEYYRKRYHDNDGE